MRSDKWLEQQTKVIIYVNVLFIKPSILFALETAAWLLTVYDNKNE